MLVCSLCKAQNQKLKIHNFVNITKLGLKSNSHNISTTTDFVENTVLTQKIIIQQYVFFYLLDLFKCLVWSYKNITYIKTLKTCFTIYSKLILFNIKYHVILYKPLLIHLISQHSLYNFCCCKKIFQFVIKWSSLLFKFDVWQVITRKYWSWNCKFFFFWSLKSIE